MFSSLGNMFGRKPAKKGGPVIPEPNHNGSPLRRDTSRGTVYSKIFRWRLPDGKTQEPSTVEVVGSFSHWQKVPMVRDSVLDAWHVTVHHIVGNRTHHYMLLVDGKPTYLVDGQWLRTPALAGVHHYTFRYLPWDVLCGAILMLAGIGLSIQILRGRVFVIAGNLETAQDAPKNS